MVKIVLDVDTINSKGKLYDDVIDGNDVFYRVNNFSALYMFMDMLYSKYEWAKDYFGVEQKAMLQNNPKDTSDIVLSEAAFSNLEGWRSNINTKVQVFSIIIDSLVEEQEPTILNIKLPSDKISNLEKLNELNYSIDKMLKCFITQKGLGGEFQLKGFDTGSDWYKILLTVAPTAYLVIMGCLNIAEKSFSVIEKYHNSKEAKIKYEKILEMNKTDPKNRVSFEEFNELSNKEKIKKDISDLLKEYNINKPINGVVISEIEKSLSVGIEEAIELMKEGTRFQLSLNPFTEQDIKDGIKLGSEELPKLNKSQKAIEDNSTEANKHD